MNTTHPPHPPPPPPPPPLSWKNELSYKEEAPPPNIAILEPQSKANSSHFHKFRWNDDISLANLFMMRQFLNNECSFNMISWFCVLKFGKKDLIKEKYMGYYSNWVRTFRITLICQKSWNSQMIVMMIIMMIITW